MTLITLTVVLLVMLIVFNVTQLTTEKEKLQNTADAVAYSIAVVEGRDLNFAAYTNRAMVANQVAIGQFIGIVSWVRYLYQMSFNLWVVGKLLELIGAIPILKPIGVVGRALATFFKTIKNVLYRTIMPALEEKIINNLIYGLNFLLKFLSIAQGVFHYASVETAISTWQQVMEDNDPDAKTTAVGIAALGLHELNWLSGFTKWAIPDHRFADVTMESRDRFTQYRGYEFVLIDTGLIGGLWPLTIGPIKLYFNFKLSWAKRGGSELLYHKPRAGSGTGGRRRRTAEECAPPIIVDDPVCVYRQCNRQEMLTKIAGCGWWLGPKVNNMETACQSAPTDSNYPSYYWTPTFYNGSANVLPGDTAVTCDPVPNYCYQTVDPGQITACRELEKQYEICFSQCAYERGWDLEYACREFPDPNPPPTSCYYDSGWFKSVWNPFTVQYDQVTDCNNKTSSAADKAACNAYPGCITQCKEERGGYIGEEECRTPMLTTCDIPVGYTCPTGTAPVWVAAPTSGDYAPYPNYATAYGAWYYNTYRPYLAAKAIYDLQVANCPAYDACLATCYSDGSGRSTPTECASTTTPPPGPTRIMCEPPWDCRPLILPESATGASDEANAEAQALTDACEAEELTYDWCISSCFSERNLTGATTGDSSIYECRDKISPVYTQCVEEARQIYLQCMEMRQDVIDNNAEEEAKYQECLNTQINLAARATKYWSWVGLDVAGLEFTLGFGLKIWLPIIEWITIIPPPDDRSNIPIPSIPLSFAAARTGPKKPPAEKGWKAPYLDKGRFGDARTKQVIAYNLAKYMWAKDGKVIMPLVPANKKRWNPLTKGTSTGQSVYDGPGKYMKVKNIGYIGNTSPGILIEIKKGATDAIFKSGSMKFSGRFDTSSDLPDNMFAVSKAELVFDRGTYENTPGEWVGLFPRKDKLEEYGNLFNPYWQARLTKLSDEALGNESDVLWYIRSVKKKDF